MSDPKEKRKKDHIDFPIDWNEASYRIISKSRRTSSERFRIALRPYFLGFNQVEIDAPISHPPHRHSSFELIAVKQGPYHCHLNGQRIEIGTTQCLLIKPGDLHEVDLYPGQKHYVLQFDLESGAANISHNILIFDKALSSAHQAFTAPIAEIEPLIKTIAIHSKSSLRFASEIQDSLIENLFWLLLSHIPEERLAPAFRKISNDQRFLDNLEKTAQNNAANHLTLDKLAHLMNLSKSTIAKRCSELLGESPSHYLLRSKIEQAAHLLKTTNAPIKEVSFDLGFQNPYHFSRVFKRFTGQSPSGFRNAISSDKKLR